MKEIGGYIELDTYTGAMLHEKAIALNCGRGALEYLCEAKMIRKLYLPYFLCDSVPNLCKKKLISKRNARRIGWNTITQLIFFLFRLTNDTEKKI